MAGGSASRLPGLFNASPGLGSGSGPAAAAAPAPRSPFPARPGGCEPGPHPWGGESRALPCGRAPAERTSASAWELLRGSGTFRGEPGWEEGGSRLVRRRRGSVEESTGRAGSCARQEDPADPSAASGAGLAVSGWGRGSENRIETSEYKGGLRDLTS